MANRRPFASSFDGRVQAVLWGLAFVFYVYLSMLVFGWPAALIRSMLLFICHIINFYVWYSVLMPRYYEKKRYVMAFTLLIVLLLVLLVVRLIIEKRFVPIPGFPMARFINSNTRAAVTIFSEISVIILASLLRFAVRHEEAKLKMADLEHMQLESELRFLKAQMNPHFLFNAINNIYSLTLTHAANAPDALLKLSGLLRYMLYESHDKVPMQKELNALKAYAELFQLRYEHPLKLEITSQVQAADSVLIEPLLLVPLLENACKHSGLGIEESAYAKFFIKEEGRDLVIDVENSKTTASASEEPGGIGLANIRKRLTMIYNDQYTLNITEDEHHFHVTLRIPL